MLEPGTRLARVCRRVVTNHFPFISPSSSCALNNAPLIHITIHILLPMPRIYLTLGWPWANSTRRHCKYYKSWSRAMVVHAFNPFLVLSLGVPTSCFKNEPWNMMDHWNWPEPSQNHPRAATPNWLLAADSWVGSVTMAAATSVRSKRYTAAWLKTF